MAFNDQGGISAGAIGPGVYIDEVMKYDKDKVGALLYIKKGTTKLMHMIHKRFGTRNVTSFTPKWFDVDELDTIFTCVTDQTTTTFSEVVMTNGQALQLQPGDLLAVDGLFLCEGENGGTPGTYSRIWTDQHRMEEVMMVTSEPVVDSAGTGLAKVIVRRGYGNLNSTDRIAPAPSASADGVIKASDKLMHLGNAQWTGSDAPRGRGKNIEVDSNYLQIQRVAFEAQTETDKESTFMPEKPLSIAQKLAMNNMAYTLEWAALFGRRTREQNGMSWRYTTGGLFEYVNKSFDYSKGGTVTSMDWMSFQRNVMLPVFEQGGSSDKVAFCSQLTYSLFAEMLWNKTSININEEWTKAFGFQVTEIHGAEGSLKLIPSWVYSQNRFRASQMLVIDFGGPNFKIDIMEQLHLEDGLQLPGQRIIKKGYITIAGMQRRARQYHSLIVGLPTVV